MSGLIHSSTSKKSASKSKSNHNPATPETTPSPAPVPSSTAPSNVAPDPVSTNSPPSPSIDALSKKALAQLEATEAMLQLDIVIPPNDKYQLAATKRVSDTAIGLASDIVSAAPERFPDFADLPSAASYVKIVGQVASRASELATHLQKSVLNQRAPAATKTLALYGVVRSLGRIEGNETMREKVAALKAEIAPKRTNPKPKVTKEQKAAKRSAAASAKRLAKAMKVIATAGASAPAAASAAPPGTVSAASPGGSQSAPPITVVTATPNGVAAASPNGAAPAPTNGVATASPSAAPPANGAATAAN